VGGRSAQGLTFAPAVTQIFENMRRRGDQLVTSALTLGEVLTRPLGIMREFGRIVPSGLRTRFNWRARPARERPCSSPAMSV
jgi:hypothetical protein